VIAVVLFHAQFAGAPGGFLGVSLFFTLSGFLITTLLIQEQRTAGTIDLRRFYARRVRRLVPAAYACLLGVALLGGLWAAEQQRHLPGDLVAAVLNVANWRFAFADSSYQDLFLAEPSPVAHFWSLAIEEQIYLLLPLVVIAALRGGRRTLAWTTAGLLVASVASTLLTADRNLVYNGTHTRAAELLVGVALAQYLAWDRPTADGVAGHRGAGWLAGRWAGPLALAAFVALVMGASIDQAWIYSGGLVAVALVSAVLIAAVVAGGFPARLLSVRPLVVVGTMSYGIYLFHWPVFLLLDGARTGLDGVALFLLRCAVTAALTVVSYRLLEQPIRQGRVVGRDRSLAPLIVVGGVAVTALALVVVPTPALTDTEQLLALGEQEVVQFGVTGPAPRPTEPRAEPTPVDTPAPTVEVPPPARVGVLGSDQATALALGVDGRFEVIDATRPDCPLSAADTPGCPPLVERWRESLAEEHLDVLVLVANQAEARDSLAKRTAAVTDEDLTTLGASDDAAMALVRETIDAAAATGVTVVWYTPAHPLNAYHRHFERVAVERPVAVAIEGGARTLADRLAALVDDEAAPRLERFRVLVIGDSTSLNFAQALHEADAAGLDVLWAGANGCPLAPVQASRGRSDASWTESGCPAWSEKVPPLVESFDPDVLLVMTGPIELQEHRFAGDATGYTAPDRQFAAARDAQMGALLAALPAELPVLIADVPFIAEGRFSGPEMAVPERLAAINADVAALDTRYDQLARFPYRDVLEAAEAERPPGDPIRSDGVHPDVEPLAALARDVYIPRLRALADQLRATLVAAPPR
jgi:peptidoglycan/LPS O-acetylase OafA/YrhL